MIRTQYHQAQVQVQIKTQTQAQVCINHLKAQIQIKIQVPVLPYQNLIIAKTTLLARIMKFKTISPNP